MVDPGARSCPQCGHAQAGGEFCEVCGTRLAAAAAAGFPPAGGAGGAAPPPPVSGPGAATPPPYAAQPQPVYGGYPAGGQEPGFFAKLFDFSFENFITPTIIKALFIIYIVVVALISLAMVIVAFTQSALVGGGGPQTLDRSAAGCSLNRRVCVHAALGTAVKYASSGV